MSSIHTIALIPADPELLATGEFGERPPTVFEDEENTWRPGSHYYAAHSTGRVALVLAHDTEVREDGWCRIPAGPVGRVGRGLVRLAVKVALRSADPDALAVLRESLPALGTLLLLDREGREVSDV